MQRFARGGLPGFFCAVANNANTDDKGRAQKKGGLDWENCGVERQRNGAILSALFKTAGRWGAGGFSMDCGAGELSAAGPPTPHQRVKAKVLAD